MASGSRPDYTLESGFDGIVCGIDEAGRGPLAGPVVAAAVVLDRTRIPAGLNDSKLVAPLERETLYRALVASAKIGVGVAEVGEIDRDNILNATMAAMARALAALPMPPGLALIDGNRSPILPCAGLCVVGGDGRSLSIAAASIVAKVTRDRIMAKLARAFPGYGWDHNAGYPTAEHRAALVRLGPSPHHRLSFRPVREAADRILVEIHNRGLPTR